jgi:FMN reductase
VSGVRVLGIDGSPVGGGRTRVALDVLLEGAAAAGAQTSSVSLASHEPGAPAEILDLVAGADAFVFGSPVYRASYASPLKAFIDGLPRGFAEGEAEPIRGRAVALLLTGASWHHYLALNELRNVLAGFFAAHVLSPGCYVPASGYSDDKQQLQPPFDAIARAQGAALVALAAAVSASPALAGVKPQA